jgi:hypothetical protein
MQRWHRILFAMLALVWAGRACAEDSSTVRLGFLLNFARYVDWPEATLKPASSLHFCLAPGDMAMSAQFGELSRQSIQGRAIQTRLLLRASDVSGCHVLYLSAETSGALSGWLAAAQQAGALTVGDLPDFVDFGGMIGLVPVGGRYRFDINLGVARQADLRFSSQLLKLARTVK